MADANAKQELSCSWEEQEGFSRVRRTISFSFPLCYRCKEHQDELSNKRLQMVAAVAGLSILVMLIVMALARTMGYGVFILIGITVSALLIWFFDSRICVDELGEEHASRGPSVSMSRSEKSGVTFRFRNPVYAHHFAQANDAVVNTQTMPQYSYGRSLFKGRSALQVIGLVVALTFIGHSIVYAALKSRREESRSSPSGYTSRTMQAPNVGTRRYTSTSGSKDTLRTEIENGEEELRTTKVRLDSLNSQIERYKRDIRQFESKISNGSYVNRSTYEQTVEKHNDLVRQYNQLLTIYKGKINRVNSLVEEYNRTF